MLKKIQYAALVAAVTLVNTAAYAQDGDGGGLDLTTKANTLVDTLDALGLPVLIVAIVVGVFGYWFKAVGIGFAAAIVIGGVIFGSAPELASFLLA